MSDKTIKVSELYQSSSLITRDAARDLFKVISHLPETYIKLDFSNVQYASRSFFDELNSNHRKFRLLGKEVEFCNLNDSLSQLYQKVRNTYVDRNSFIYSSVASAQVINI